MRLTLAAIAAGFISFGMTLSAAQADAVKVSPEMTVFTKERGAPDVGSPTVLRGSATKRGTVHHGYSGYDERGPFPIGAGSTLWISDPRTGEIVACEPSRTSRVGSRHIRCFD